MRSSTSFAAQWLQLRMLDAVSPENRKFDGNLRQALRTETEMLFSSVVREDRSVVDLLDADYTFVDERLAQHYGLPNIRGSRFRRVELPPSSPRRGLLGQGSLLTLTSAPNRTSPVKRGQWVLNNLLGTPAPQPPDNVETNLEETAPAGEATTMRERLVQHQANPSCAMCHSLIDPLGFALENFDSIGEWRDTEAGQAVNSHGTFIDGSDVDGVAGLRALSCSIGASCSWRALTERLLTYALGRTLEPYDMPVVREIVRTAAQDDYRFSALVQGIVASEPMQFRMKLSGDEPATGSRQLGTTEVSAMFITKKHLSRRTLLRGAGAAIALPLLDSMIPARTALAQTAATPKTRLGCIYIPHGVTMDKWTPATTGRDFELTEILSPLAPVRDQICVVSGLTHAPVAPWAGEDSGGANNHNRAGAVFLSGAHPVKGNTRRLRPQHRSDRRGADRPRHADTLDRAGARAGRAQLRQRQHLRLHQHAGVEVGDAAAADGAQPAGGVRALVRPRRHRCRARGAAYRSEQRARLGARAIRQAAEARCPRPIGACSPTTSRKSARSSAASCRSTR